MSGVVKIRLFEDPSYGVYAEGFQISIEDNSGGYRILGPKFIGRSRLIKEQCLSERDCLEVRQYINSALRRFKKEKEQVDKI